MASISKSFQEEGDPSHTQESATPNARSPAPRHRIVQAALPFLIGGTSGMAATICIQPIDMVKVRIQMLGSGSKTGPKPNPFIVARDIVSKGRFLDLYSGLSAGLLRQVVYGTSRLGLFFTFEDLLNKRAAKHGREVTMLERSAAALSAGGLGAIIGNPTEVGLVRMQSDGMRPAPQRQNYRSVFDALARIARGEGVRALWSGAAPTVIRAMSTNLGQLATFSEAKHLLGRVEWMSEQARTVSSSAIAGFFAAGFSLPFDFVKTRLQSQDKWVAGEGKKLYKGMADCFVRVAREEGLSRFYRGFSVYFFRIAPHTIISLIIADNLKRILI